MGFSLTAAAVLSAALAILACVGCVSAYRRRRFMLGTFAVLLAALGGALAALFATISVSIRGYAALTREETAAWVTTTPTGPQTFRAVVRLPDGAVDTFELRGDELYVDAHILKWKPIANLFGLHTAYELDRIAGRYLRAADEANQTRTVHPLAEDRALDLFDLRRRYAWLAPLVDADYGSATFVPAVPAEYEIRVSTTGLLARRVTP